MKFYVTPEMNITSLSALDVIATSGVGEEPSLNTLFKDRAQLVDSKDWY